MSLGYSGIQWSRQKRWYDLALIVGLLVAFGSYVGVSSVLRPQLTIESLIIRGSALCAFVLLHAILCIGPLARLDRRFLPLLFNRRHLGVTMFLLALLHATFAVLQFHTQGDVHPLVSVFTAYRVDYDPFVDQTVNISHFPFEPLGLAALTILFLMAATSHDFWLRTLGPSLWKTLHLLVLSAYLLLVGHVALGVLQSERHWFYTLLVGVGAAVVCGLHLTAALRERAADRARRTAERDGYLEGCALESLVEGRGKSVVIGDSRVALYRHAGRVYAVSNVCRHQGGPLGEGRIVDGCITCPWHGWQYRANDGCSPPPFQERIETHRVRIVEGRVYVDPRAAAAGTPQPGAEIP